MFSIPVRLNWCISQSCSCVFYSAYILGYYCCFSVFETIPVISLCIDKSCVVGSRCVQLKTWFDYRNHVCIVSDLSPSTNHGLSLPSKFSFALGPACQQEFVYCMMWLCHPCQQEKSSYAWMCIALKSLPSLRMDSDLGVMKAMLFIMNVAGGHCSCNIYEQCVW